MPLFLVVVEVVLVLSITILSNSCYVSYGWYGGVVTTIILVINYNHHNSFYHLHFLSNIPLNKVTDQLIDWYQLGFFGLRGRGIRKSSLKSNWRQKQTDGRQRNQHYIVCYMVSCKWILSQLEHIRSRTIKRNFFNISQKRWMNLVHYLEV